MNMALWSLGEAETAGSWSFCVMARLTSTYENRGYRNRTYSLAVDDVVRLLEDSVGRLWVGEDDESEAAVLLGFLVHDDIAVLNGSEFRKVINKVI